MLSRILVIAVIAASPTANLMSQDTSVGDKLVTDYFRGETQKLTDNAFADINSLEDWTSRKAEYRRQLFEMLGMDPMPERTPLEATVVGKLDEEEFFVERLHFQSRPGMYVGANLYVPKKRSGPAPAILYVCGHGSSRTDGISNGNKVRYQHHGSWFARNGYVCLIVDTIQLGEFPGIHHGTYREKMWWWNSRGYSSAGAEAWNSIRALDYLESRPEVDKDRMGVTGRSGGGAHSWYVAALDERIKAAVPVAGITSLHNHVVDGCVEGHCDCMYMVNTYRWDYPLIAALVAPRPLLISNTDKDRIFPLDGVIDVYGKTRKIYELYDAKDKLGLHITEGPHKDTQELRVHAMRWMNRWLKDDDSLIGNVATPFFEPQQLRVFDKLPQNEIVTTAHESFVRKANEELPLSDEAFELSQRNWMKRLDEIVFRGWPAEPGELNVTKIRQHKADDITTRHYEFTTQAGYRLPFFTLEQASEITATTPKVNVTIVGQETWDQRTAASLAGHLGDRVGEPLIDVPEDGTVVIFPPRGIGPTEWTRDAFKRTQIRRRFMQLGQTVAGMQVWDLRRLLQAIDTLDETKGKVRSLNARGNFATIAAFASLYEPRIEELVLTKPPASHRAGPDLLNVSRVLSVKQLMLLASHRVGKLTIRCASEKECTPWKPLASHPLGHGKINLTVDD